MSTQDRWIDRISPHIEGDLTAEETAELEAHLSGCPACRAVHDEMLAVIADAGRLPLRQPPRDLWPEIRARLDEGDRTRAEEADVIELPTAVRREDRSRRVELTHRQLIAASIVLVALSAAITTWLGPDLGGAPPVAVAPPPEADAVTMVSSTVLPPDLSAELQQLETALADARAGLDPNTVRVLERNLAVIERAIAESREALALDPGNDFLAGHLERSYQRKVEYLRDAARVIAWSD